MLRDARIVLRPLALLPLLLLAAAAGPRDASGVYSTAARSIGDSMAWAGAPGPLTGTARFPSPDRRSTLDIRFVEKGTELDRDFSQRTLFTLNGAAGRVRFEPGMPLGDILWSPDSRRVALSVSGGGLNGVYRLFVASGGKVIDRSTEFSRRVKLPRACYLRDNLNVGALTWLSQTHLLVVVQPLWEEECAQRADVAFFDYDVATGRFARVRPAGAALQRYRALFGSVLQR